MQKIKTHHLNIQKYFPPFGSSRWNYFLVVHPTTPHPHHNSHYWLIRAGGESSELNEQICINPDVIDNNIIHAEKSKFHTAAYTIITAQPCT